MRVLAAGFNGDNNSAKILLDRLPDSFGKLYLQNDKKESVDQLLKIAAYYDIILAFGQKPVLKNKVSVETQAVLNGDILLSDFDFEGIKNFFAEKYPLKFSNNAGTSYCNNLYYYGLKELTDTEHKMIFIHLPMIKNIDDMETLVCSVKSYIDYLA